MSSSSSTVKLPADHIAERSSSNVLPAKIAWGGAGLSSSQPVTAKKGLPSHRTRDNSNFSAIQSEDLAKKIDVKETMKVYSAHQNNDEACLSTCPSTSNGPPPFDEEYEYGAGNEEMDIANDLCIAQALQYDMNLQHDLELDTQQKQLNRNSKLNIILSKHKILSDVELDSANDMPWENLPIDDIMAYDHMKSVSSSSGKKKKYTKQDKAGKSTYSGHFDDMTTRILRVLLSKGELRTMGGIISTGKEAAVYHSTGGSTEDGPLPENCVVKIFKTKLTEFKNRESYIKDDHRFANRVTKTNSTKNILLWAEKEMRNMKRIYSAGVACPTPLLCYSNVLVMSLIGTPLMPAPQIRSVELPLDLWIDAYEQTLEIMDAITNKCRLVHGDLSEYNLLYESGKVYVIDFAQAVDLTHCNSLSFLYRDCCNVANFFHKKRVPNVLPGLQLFQKITKLSLEDTNDENQIAEVESELDMWKGSDCYSDAMFEYLWNASQIRIMMVKDAGLAVDESEYCKTGCVHKEEWVTKKTDTSVIKSTSGTSKKKRNRKNSTSKNSITVASSTDKTNSASPTEDEGFCIVNSKDCIASKINSKSNSRKGKQRVVRFYDTDTAADTEDYNGDADTDEVTDTTDVDTDFNATEDCDTEGYHGDADDTDNCVSDTNGRVLNVSNNCDDVDTSDTNADPLSLPRKVTSHSTSLHTNHNVNNKRPVKKRNKKNCNKK